MDIGEERSEQTVGDRDEILFRGIEKVTRRARIRNEDILYRLKVE